MGLASPYYPDLVAEKEKYNKITHARAKWVGNWHDIFKEHLVQAVPLG